MSSAEGEELGRGGVYLEVVPNELLCFLHAWDDANGAPGEATRVTVTFEDVDERITRMVLRQTGFASERSRAEHEAGWMQCFERLAQLMTRPASPRAMPTRRRSASL